MNLLHIVEAFTKGVTAVKVSVDILKKAKDQLPEGEEKASVGQKIEEAERALKLANAEMGQSLGYQLCQCTWPPQVMVSIGYVKEDHVEQFKCSHCQKILSVPAHPKTTEKVTAFDPYDMY